MSTKLRLGNVTENKKQQKIKTSGKQRKWYSIHLRTISGWIHLVVTRFTYWFVRLVHIAIVYSDSSYVKLFFSKALKWKELIKHSGAHLILLVVELLVEDQIQRCKRLPAKYVKTHICLKPMKLRIKSAQCFSSTLKCNQAQLTKFTSTL